MDQLFYNFDPDDDRFQLAPPRPTGSSASQSSWESTDDESQEVVLCSSRKRALSSSQMESFAEHVSARLRCDAMTAYAPTASKDDLASQPCAKKRRIEDPTSYLCSLPSSSTRSLLLHQSSCHSEIATFQLGESAPRLELEIMRPLFFRGKCLVAFKVTDAIDSPVDRGVTRFPIPAQSCSHFNRFNGIWGIIELDSNVNIAEMADFSEPVMRCLKDAYSRRYTDCVLMSIPFHGACATPRSDTPSSRHRYWGLDAVMADSEGETFEDVFCDHLQIHADVFEIANLVHRNIGVHSLMVDHEESAVIVDWDLAQEYYPISFTQTPMPFYCVGVKTFAAKEVLQFRSRLHLFRYDLESFVWTLVWLLDYCFGWTFHLTEAQEPRNWHESTFKDAVRGRERILKIFSGRVSGPEHLRKRDDWVDDFKKRVVTILKRIQFDQATIYLLKNERRELVAKYNALAKDRKAATRPDRPKFSPQVNELEQELLLNTRQIISGDDGFNTDEFLEIVQGTQRVSKGIWVSKV